MAGVCNVGIDNEKRLQIDLVKGAYKMRFFLPDCNTMGSRMKWSSSYARPLTFLQVCK